MTIVSLELLHHTCRLPHLHLQLTQGLTPDYCIILLETFDYRAFLTV